MYNIHTAPQKVVKFLDLLFTNDTDTANDVLSQYDSDYIDTLNNFLEENSELYNFIVQNNGIPFPQENPVYAEILYKIIESETCDGFDIYVNIIEQA